MVEEVKTEEMNEVFQTNPIEAEKRFPDLVRILTRNTKFPGVGGFEPGEDLLPMLLDDVKVLVVGAGGLGCEILKDLALSGIQNIHVIDMDKIDVTNLNRQFLFRKKDVGNYKARVAADFVMRRCPGVKIETSIDACQKYDEDFYRQFQVVICGLDNVEARRWINSMVHQLAINPETGKVDNPDDIPETIMIDGGTEGFQGQARVIVPF